MWRVKPVNLNIILIIILVTTSSYTLALEVPTYPEEYSGYIQYGFGVDVVEAPVGVASVGGVGFAPVSGELRVLVLMLDFSNYVHQTSASTVLNKVSKVDSYIREVSYGQAWLTIVDLGMWLQLPQTREYYGADSTTQYDVNYMDYVYDALTLADPYVDYRTIDYVFLVHAGYSQATSGNSYDLWSSASRGKWYFSFDGGVYLGWMIVAERDYYGVFIHEFGHNLGLKDLYDYNYRTLFVGKWSVMGGQGGYLNPPASFLAVEKSWLGWFSVGQVYSFSGSGYVYLNISPLEVANGLKMVKIPAGTVYYTLEYRRRILTDSALPGEGVIIAWVDESLPSGSGPIRVVDRNPSTFTKDDAYYRAGDIYINRDQNFYVKVVKLTQDYATVLIQRGFPNLLPINITYVNISRVYNFTISIENQGVETPSPFKVALYVNGVAKAVETVNVSLASGATVTVEFHNITLPIGNNTISVKVDVGNNIVESSEDDNILELNLYVPPKYYLQDFIAVPGTRVDIGSNVTVQIYFTAGDGVTPYANQTVKINNQEYVTNASGWLTLTLYRDDVGDITLQLTDPEAIQKKEVKIIFDKVSIILFNPEGRVDVGRRAPLRYVANYAYDGQPFKGYIYLNDTLIKDEVGLYIYGVIGITDKKYGLTKFQSNVMKVIFDRVVINITVRERVDIGESNPITVEAYYEYDGEPFQGRILFNNSFGYPIVTAISYRVIGIEDYLYGLTAYTAYPKEFQIIYDKVIINLTVSRERFDVGREAEINIEAYYAYDGKPFQGTVIFNNSLIQNVTGRYIYTVSSIIDNLYNLTVYEADTVEVIFDRVIITLEVFDTYLNIGENASITWSGVYEYDNTSFQGRIYLNGSTIQNTPGKYIYIVEAIEDQLYGLTVYISNSVEIVFDAVEVDLIVEDNRIDVGSKANITITARYAYSGEPYPGVLKLNDTLVKYEVGLYWYGVELIQPDNRGITALYYEPVYIIFDRIVIKQKIDNRVDVGGNPLDALEIYYEYDGTPFIGEVYLNDSTILYEVGVYSYRVVGVRDVLHGLTVYTSIEFTVVYDKVVIEVLPLKTRYNVGEEIRFNVYAYYAYDGKPFIGEIFFNGSLVQNSSGRYLYIVEAILDKVYGLTVYQANQVEVIVDRVIIFLKPSSNRIDVGSKAEIEIIAYYEYDGEPFQGRVYLNDTLVKTSVGKVVYGVDGIVDELYGLTAYIDYPASVIFDRIVVRLEALKTRVDVGSNAPIKIYAYYEYDGQPLQGEVILNNPFKIDRVGKVVYRVEKVIDNLYNLSIYVSNSVEIVFDKVVVKLTVEDSRIDVGGNASIKVSAFYAYDGQPFKGRIYLNDSTVKDSIGRYIYTVAYIIDELHGLTRFEANTVEVIYDRVVVELKPTRERIDVGSEAEIQVYAYYEYDGQPFKGEILLNDSLKKDEVGRYIYTVEAVRDELYGLTVYKANTVEIIFDRVVIELTPAKQRIDVGSEAKIEINAYYEYDGKLFKGDILLNDSLIQYEVGRYAVTVESIVDRRYGLTAYIADTIEIIYDRVVVKLSIEDSRIDVGRNASIKVDAYYEYDRKPFKGEIILNASTIQNKVGRYIYTVEAIRDELYGLTTFISNTVEVIYDRVIIKLSPESQRIDVGSNASIKIEAFYEYDGKLFKGKIHLNDTLTKDIVGRYFITVAYIEDSLYGLTTYKANTVEIIYDTVIIELYVEENILPVGATPNITFKAYYAYDNQPFQGEIYLNDSLKKDKPGKFIYTVETIIDQLHGLTTFQSNTIEIIFDKPVVEVVIDMSRPFLTKVWIGIYLDANESYIKGVVEVNGVYIEERDSRGRYLVNIQSYLPFHEIDVKVWVGESEVKDVTVKYRDVLSILNEESAINTLLDDVLPGNVVIQTTNLILILIPAIAVAIVVSMLRKKR